MIKVIIEFSPDTLSKKDKSFKLGKLHKSMLLIEHDSFIFISDIGILDKPNIFSDVNDASLLYTFVMIYNNMFISVIMARFLTLLS